MGVFVIGIIGKIGAGKSTVAALFGARGARVIDADRIAHGVLTEPAVIAEVLARFGAGVLAADAAAGRRIERRALASLVFGPGPEHAAALRDLEAIVHPRVHERIAAALEEARRAPVDGVATTGIAGPVVVLDVPLLVQAGWVRACDLVVVLECDDEVRRGRISARFSPQQIAAREASWERSRLHLLPAGKARNVDTSCDPAYTRTQIDRIWDELPLLPRLDGGSSAGSS
jgi:dephospho-CoA kinase